MTTNTQPLETGITSTISPTLSSKTLLVLGATSDIAIATLKELAKDGWGFHLAGRDLNALSALAQDLTVRSGFQVTYSQYDTAMSVSEQQEFWQQVLTLTTSTMPTQYNKPAQIQSENPQSSLEGVLCAVGYLGQTKPDLDDEQLILQANFTGLVPTLSLAANYFEQKKSGSIIVISSVAGDRGRASNYPYGSAKAGLTAYVSGLRARLFPSNVHVMTVLPGFVKTKMTAHLQLPAKLLASPEEVAQAIIKGMKLKSSMVYVKWIWRYIMFIIKHVPEPIFKRMNKL